MPTMEELCRDLEAETEALEALLDGLDDPGWDTPTPAEGWAVRDQVSHLAYFDEAATLAATDGDAFRALVARTAADPDSITAEAVDRGRAMSPTELHDWFRTARGRMLDVFRRLDPKERLPWYGPPMSAASFATARLMETWAHGQDVADALRTDRAASERLYHVCHIGVRALPFSFTNRGLPVPDEPIRVELRAPSGETWTWGPEGAADVVRGEALDFALVVTQRRHLDDTGLQVEGPVARRWIEVAQAFAGPPGEGRQPGQFAQR